ncbi:hypothetical protein BDB01DRAFT_815124 [Pilobolus umbonatus]|nr:hypothetical protein BDB01DRAFT_815124 [Pilobolus umbonatus]
MRDVLVKAVDEDKFEENLDMITEILSDKSLFINEQAMVDFDRYFHQEFMDHIHKWAAKFTSGVLHFGCTTTQRAESDHSALKNSLIKLLPLQMSFGRVHTYLEAFDRSYNEIVVEETKRIDVVVVSEHKLKMLLGKVGKIALFNIRKELYKAHNTNTEEECHCKVRINFNLPCCHTLISIDREYLYLKDIPSRWWLTDENIDDNAERNDEALATQSLAYKP